MNNNKKKTAELLLDHVMMSAVWIRFVSCACEKERESESAFFSNSLERFHNYVNDQL